MIVILCIVELHPPAVGAAVQVAAFVPELAVAISAYPVIGAAVMDETCGAGAVAQPEEEVTNGGAAVLRTLVRLIDQVDVVSARAVVQVAVDAYPARALVVVIKIPDLTFTIMAYHHNVGDVVGPRPLRSHQQRGNYQ